MPSQYFYNFLYYRNKLSNQIKILAFMWLKYLWNNSLEKVGLSVCQTVQHFEVLHTLAISHEIRINSAKILGSVNWCLWHYPALYWSKSPETKIPTRSFPPCSNIPPGNESFLENSLTSSNNILWNVIFVYAIKSWFDRLL